MFETETSNITHECLGGEVKENVVIFTPGFPYDASVPCDFFLKVDAGKRVETEILLVEANECCDHLVLYEGSLGGKVIVNFTGEESGGNTHKSSSNVMKVSWMPNGGYNVRGAMFQFRGV